MHSHCRSLYTSRKQGVKIQHTNRKQYCFDEKRCCSVIRPNDNSHYRGTQSCLPTAGKHPRLAWTKSHWNTASETIYLWSWCAAWSSCLWIALSKAKQSQCSGYARMMNQDACRTSKPTFTWNGVIANRKHFLWKLRNCTASLKCRSQSDMSKCTCTGFSVFATVI